LNIIKNIQIMEIFTITLSDEIVSIREKVQYNWAGQKGFFRKEDENIIAWMPGATGEGIPTYYSPAGIQRLSDTVEPPFAC